MGHVFGMKMKGNKSILLSKSEGQEYIVNSSNGSIYLKQEFRGKGSFAQVYKLKNINTGIFYAGKITSKSTINLKNMIEAEAGYTNTKSRSFKLYKILRND
jgi:serine/threonine protein kinase